MALSSSGSMAYVRRTPQAMKSRLVRPQTRLANGDQHQTNWMGIANPIRQMTATRLMRRTRVSRLTMVFGAYWRERLSCTDMVAGAVSAMWCSTDVRKKSRMQLSLERVSVKSHEYLKGASLERPLGGFDG